MISKIDGKYRTTIVPESFVQFMKALFPTLTPAPYTKAEELKAAFLQNDIPGQLQIYITLSGKCYVFLDNMIYTN